jgi:hypothetical protein
MNTFQKSSLFILMTAFMVSLVLLATKPFPKPEDLPMPPAPSLKGKVTWNFEAVANKLAVTEPLSAIEKAGVLAGDLKEDIEELALTTITLENAPCGAAELKKLPGLLNQAAGKLASLAPLGVSPLKIELMSKAITRSYVTQVLKSGALNPATVPRIFVASLDRPPEAFYKDHEERIKACK